MFRIIQSPSPNFQPSIYTKFGIQIHKTLGLMPETLAWLRNPRAWVSSHYLIAKNGDIHQLVQLKDRCWASGRINRPSQRAKNIMLKTRWGGYVKPGHYLIQIEFECLLNETYTEEQYQSAVWLFGQFGFDITEENFLTHRDTAIDKPNLEEERFEILRRLKEPDECDSKRLVLDNWKQFGVKVENGKIIIFKNI